MRISLKSTFVCSAILIVQPVTVTIAETTYPRIEAVIPFEIENDYSYKSDDPAAEQNNTFAVIEPEVTVHFSDSISVVAGFVFEAVNDPVGDRFFEDQGLFIQQLFAQYSGDNFNVKAGKFNPTFAVAWDKAAGIYGVDFAEDYELTEKIGFGADATFGDEASGEHTLSASTFFSDTSVLSQTFINSRGQPRISDGGAGNTEDLSSFAVSLDSESVPALGGLGYTLGVAQLGKGVGNTDDETTYAVGLFGSFDVTDEIAIEPLVEYVRRDNTGGTIADADYITLSSALLYGPWNLSASYTNRTTDPNTPTTPELEDHLYQVSGGYGFENGLTADLGYRFAEEVNVDTHVIGVLFTYELEVAYP